MSNNDVKDLIENSKQVVIKKIEELPKQGESKSWKILTVVLPIVLSAVLGIIIFITESKIIKQIDDQSKNYLTQLAVAEHYTKLKLQVYSDIATEMAVIVEALENADSYTVEKTSAIDRLAELRMVSISNVIFIEENIDKSLEELWIAGVNMPVLCTFSGNEGTDDCSQLLPNQIKEFEEEVSKIVKAMKKDLNIVDIDHHSHK